MSDPLLDSTRRLSQRVARLKISGNGLVTHVYNPLTYAWSAHEAYLRRCPPTPRVVFMGMNPGPWGMAQTGVPFGEVALVRDWMGIDLSGIRRPRHEHPKRPIQGADCARSEVSGRRLWGLMAERFGTADAFFAGHFVYNYCPLVFMAESGRNVTPDKLPATESVPLQRACDRGVREIITFLQPETLVAIGAYAEKRLKEVLKTMDGKGDLPRLTRILHPSPASPAANRDWAGTAARQLQESGVW